MLVIPAVLGGAVKIAAAIAAWFGIRDAVRKAIVKRLAPGIGSAVEEALRKFTFWLSENIYPLISKFYDIFEIIGRHKFFSDNDISKISNNIYILVSVIMIFALSIKLLNSIVNPDVLTEKKNGVTSLVKRCFIAAFLVVLLPWGFNELYNLQDLMLSKSLVQKIVLNTTGFDSSDGGNILSGYTLSSLITPNYDLEAASESTNDADVEIVAGTLNAFSNIAAGNALGAINATENSINSVVTKAKLSECSINYYDMIKDPRYMSSFSSCINLKLEGTEESKYAFEYSAVATPILGGFMAYEMLLLCIDVALRTLKLGLLELIIPIMVCGYIYNSDILQRWVKEVITTFIMLFVKIAVVSVVLLGISYIPNFLSNKDEFLEHRGWIQIFLIIGLLQLIKAIPALINSIFGIKVKSSGGIKGRLGEMAGVGKIAQNAWGSFTNKAKGLGKTLAIMPLAATGSAIKNKFNKMAQKDTKTGHVLSKIKQAANGKTGAIAKTAFAGINSNGTGTVKKMRDTWNKTSVGMRNRELEFKRKEQEYNNKYHLDKGRSRTAYGDFSYTDEKGIERKIDNKGVIKDDYGNDINLNKRFDREAIKYKAKDGKIIDIDSINKMTKNEGESDADFEKRRNDYINGLSKVINQAETLYYNSKIQTLESDIDLNYNFSNSTLNKSIQSDIVVYGKAKMRKAKFEEAKSSYELLKEYLKMYISTTAAGSEENKAANSLLLQMEKPGFAEKSLTEQKEALRNTGVNGEMLESMEECLDRFSSIKSEALPSYDLTSIQKEIEEADALMKNASTNIDAVKSGNNMSLEAINELNNRVNNINVKYDELSAAKAELTRVQNESKEE